MRSVHFKVLFLMFIAASVAACGGSEGKPAPAVPAIQNEGTASQPVDLGVVATERINHAGSVAVDGDSYYQFSADRAGNYTIELLKMQTDLDWDLYVFSNYGGTPFVQCQNHSFPVDEICSVEITAPGNYYIAVINWSDTAGSYYTLSLIPPAPLPAPLYFFDFNDSNNGLQGWTSGGTGGTWSLSGSSADYHVTDSVSGNTPNNADMTLTSPVLALEKGDPAKPLLLTFRQKYDLEEFDYGYVEVSADNVSFVQVALITGKQEQFEQKTIDLSYYLTQGHKSIVVRFKLDTDTVTTFDGWHIDDIALTQQ